MPEPAKGTSTDVVIGRGLGDDSCAHAGGHGEVGVTADGLDQDVAGPADHQQLEQLSQVAHGHQDQQGTDHDGEQRTEGAADVRGGLDHRVFHRPGGRPDEIEVGRVRQPVRAVQRIGQRPADVRQRMPDQFDREEDEQREPVVEVVDGRGTQRPAELRAVADEGQGDQARRHGGADVSPQNDGDRPLDG
ncbi:hypothetical protein [Streptomyces sp. NPDC014764]|uniref:hypothetical protein n=1 Tax=Streptomyces sp. NPDC014764 TaxID=3364907 RepID=UPI003702A1E9